MFVKYLFFAESRGFFYDGGEGLVVLPLFSDMSYKQMFDEGKVGFDSSDKLFSKRKRFGLATKDDLVQKIMYFFLSAFVHFRMFQ